MKKLNFNNIIFKILSLFVLTSGVFLSVFFVTLYQKETLFLHSNYLSHFYSHHRTILQELRESLRNKNPISTDEFALLSREIEMNFAVIANDKVLFSNLTHDAFKIFKALQTNNFFTSIDGFLYADFSRMKDIDKFIDRSSVNRHRYSHFSQRYNIVVIAQTKDLGFKIQQNEPVNLSFSKIESELDKLKLKTFFYIVICILLLGFVGFFIIKILFKNIQEQFKALNDFIKDTTHEINTPLSIILACIQKFDENNLNEANAKKLFHIKLASKNLNNIYQNLIALNFLVDKNSLKSRFDLQTLINQRIEYFDTLLMQKKLSLHAKLQSVEIDANKDEMQILLDNLLSNAIKYTPMQKNIFITLTQNSLSIKDEGCGLNKSEIAEIFTRYKRFNDNLGGFGIGFNLVKQIADKNALSIDIKSEKNKGSEFIVSW